MNNSEKKHKEKKDKFVECAKQKFLCIIRNAAFAIAKQDLVAII